MQISRRDFLGYSMGPAAVLGLGIRPPQFLLQAAAREVATQGENILVVVQLSGGNDGLNTVIPHGDDQYHRHRPTLSIGQPTVLPIDDYCGFHPSLRGFADLLENGQLAVIQGVGYPNPNRSHFESMDIWHSCQRGQQERAEGWLGRYLDERFKSGGPEVPALHLGGEKQPLALVSRSVRVPSVRSLEQFRFQGGDNLIDLANLFNSTQRSASDSLLDFVQSTSTSALAASQRVATGIQSYEPQANYPQTQLAEKLKVVAQLIDADLGARVFYVELDGFDTHSQQADAHAGLLNQLGGAVSSFISDVAAHGHGNRVLLVAFSEFGRRVKENASEGTDHGAAAPMFVAGPRAVPGLHGEHPSLSDLEDGDIKHHTDFRQVYASILEEWLDWPSEPVLGASFDKINLIRA